MPGAEKAGIERTGEGPFLCLPFNRSRKVMKKAEIDGKPVKKAQRAVIGDEICLDVKDVRKYFPIYKGMMRKHIGDVKAIEDISFKVRKGETLGIVGESGCGKQHWQDALCVCISRIQVRLISQELILRSLTTSRCIHTERKWQ